MSREIAREWWRSAEADLRMIERRMIERIPDGEALTHVLAFHSAWRSAGRLCGSSGIARPPKIGCVPKS
jgi:hypothetical protein